MYGIWPAKTSTRNCVRFVPMYRAASSSCIAAGGDALGCWIMGTRARLALLRPGDAHFAVFVLLHDHAFAAAEDGVEGAVEEKRHQSLIRLLDLLPGLNRDAAVRQHLAVVGGARRFPEMREIRDAVDCA